MLAAPTVAVSGVTATREGDTSMTVSWTELTLQEAQGFPVYTVLYEPSAGPVGRVSRQATPVSGVAQPPVTVGGLDPASEYTVQVRVDTDETAARESGLVSESGQSLAAGWGDVLHVCVLHVTGLCITAMSSVPSHSSGGPPVSFSSHGTTQHPY